MSGGIDIRTAGRLLIINTLPALISKWCGECSSWIQGLNTEFSRRLNKSISNNTLKLVLPGDYGVAITNCQSGSGTQIIALELNYHRNIGGCVSSIA